MSSKTSFTTLPNEIQELILEAVLTADAEAHEINVLINISAHLRSVMLRILRRQQTLYKQTVYDLDERQARLWRELISDCYLTQTPAPEATAKSLELEEESRRIADLVTDVCRHWRFVTRKVDKIDQVCYSFVGIA
jgi:hypothetical protein